MKIKGKCRNCGEKILIKEGKKDFRHFTCTECGGRGKIVGNRIHKTWMDYESIKEKNMKEIMGI